MAYGEAAFGESSYGESLSGATLSYADEVLADAPFGFWPCEETSGSTLTDVSGNGRHMTVFGTVDFSLAGPLATAGGLSFPTSVGATDNYAKTAAGGAATQYATMEAWVKLTALPTVTTAIMGPADAIGGGQGGKVLWLKTNGSVAYATYNASWAEVVSTPLALNVWHHIVASNGPAGTKLRVDKVSVATDARQTAAYTTDSNVFLHGAGNSSRTNGAEAGPLQVAYPAYWTSQLSDARADAHYDAMQSLDNYQQQVLADAPLAYYRLGEGSGTGSVRDSSGNGRDGSYIGSTITPAAGLTSGDSNGSMDFAGGRGHISYDSSWMNPSALTAEAWIRPDTVTGPRVIVQHDDDGEASELAWRIRLDAGKVQALSYIGGTLRILNSATSPAVGQTCHVAITISGSTMKLYVNGVEEATGTWSGSVLTTSTAPIYIGKLAIFGVEDFDGRIDEVAFYDTALSAARIAAHYSAGISSAATIAVAVAQEVETAQGVVVSQGISIGQASEADTPDSLSVSAQSVVSVDSIIANEAALVVAVSAPAAPQASSIEQVSEGAEAAPLTVAQANPAVIGLQQVVESDASFSIDLPSLNRTVALGVATESDHGTPLSTRRAVLTYNDLILSDHPVAYYPMDETSGTVGVDVAGGHDGAWTGTYELGVAKIVSASEGTSVRVTAGGLIVPYGDWQAPPNLSSEIWYRPEATGITSLVMSRYNQFAGSVWQVTVSTTGRLQMTVWTNTGSYYQTETGGGFVQVGQTYHLVFTWEGLDDAHEARLYVNGVQTLIYNNMIDSVVPNVRTTSLLAFGTDTNNVYRCNGPIDEGAFYDYVLTPAQIKAHYDLGASTLPIALEGQAESQEALAIAALQDQPIRGRVVIEAAYEVDSIPADGVHGVNQYARLETAVESDGVENINNEHPWSGATTQPATMWNTPHPLQERGVAQAAEGDQAVQLTAMFDQTFTVGQAVETSTVQPFPHNLTLPLGMVVETGETTGFTLRATLTHGATGTLSLLTEDILLDPVYALTILDDQLRRAPTSLTWMMSGVPLDTTVSVYFDDETEVAGTAESNSEGMIGPVAINVHNGLAAGAHTLRAEVDGVQVAEAPFTLELEPALYPGTMGADAQALEIPGAVSHDTRHWVFQDLLAEEEGGIGSFILPINPREMSSPHQEYGMSARHTTAITGQFHIFQTGAVPKEWTFEGYCPDQATQDQMLAYRNLNRRFYIVDHRNRAWKVVITNMEFTPRMRHIFNGVETDWGSDYVVTATILDQDWVTPA